MNIEIAILIIIIVLKLGAGMEKCNACYCETGKFGMSDIRRLYIYTYLNYIDIYITINLFHLNFRLHTSCITCPSVWLEALSVLKPKENAMRNSSWCYLKLVQKTVFGQPKFFHVVKGYKWHTHIWLKTRLSLDGQGLPTNQKEINAKRSRCKHTFQPNSPIAINWEYYHPQNYSNMWALRL